jgi:hypothetical protein
MPWLFVKRQVCTNDELERELSPALFAVEDIFSNAMSGGRQEGGQP